MSEHSESIKIKMLQDAGYNNLPPVYYNYIKLVEFVKEISDHLDECVSPGAQREASRLLKEIGELE